MGTKRPWSVGVDTSKIPASDFLDAMTSNAQEALGRGATTTDILAALAEAGVLAVEPPPAPEKPQHPDLYVAHYLEEMGIAAFALLAFVRSGRIETGVILEELARVGLPAVEATPELVGLLSRAAEAGFSRWNEGRVYPDAVYAGIGYELAEMFDGPKTWPPAHLSSKATSES